MARETYKERLAELQGELLEMGKLVDQAIALSIQALANRDAALARRIIDGDVQINMALRCAPFCRCPTSPPRWSAWAITPKALRK